MTWIIQILNEFVVYNVVYVYRFTLKDIQIKIGQIPLNRLKMWGIFPQKKSNLIRSSVLSESSFLNHNNQT